MAQIIGTPRDDDLTGTSVTDSPADADDIFGLAGNDRIDGRSGNDRLFGGAGDDHLLGSLGDDMLFGEDEDDVLRGGPGDDQLFGGNGRDVVLGDEDDDLLVGDPGDDDLLGGIGDDRLEGGDGDDNLFGGTGDDHLDGGPGLDRHQGGPGADRFVLSDLDAVDEILDLDLAEGDRLDLSAVAQSALDAGGTLDEVVRLETLPSATLVSIDPDGGGFQPIALLRGAQVGQLTDEQLGLTPLTPVARSDSASTDQTTPITIDVLANDVAGGAPLRVLAVDAADTAGSVAIDPAGTTITYTPDPAFVGIDALRYTVIDERGGTDTAEVRIGVLGTGELAEIARSDDPRGFVISGFEPERIRFDLWPGAVAGAGDVNGDGLDDLIIGAPSHRLPPLDLPGAAFVVLGKGDGEAVDLRAVVDGIGGFSIAGVDSTEFVGLGVAVDGAGDVNGDGLADVIVSAIFDDVDAAGHSVVVFGRTSTEQVPLVLDLEATGDGFLIGGFGILSGSGSSVSGTGDVNGDGLADVAVGSPGSSGGNIAGGAPEVVVFGKPDSALVDPREGDITGQGYLILGEDGVVRGGSSVSGIGDINGDGLSETIIGAPDAGDSGQTYVVFGKPDSAAVTIDEVVDGVGGFVIDGAGGFFTWAGDSVGGGGDVNGDGIPDLIIGSPSNQAFVVFGKVDTASIDLDDVAAGLGGFVINGIETLIESMEFREARAMSVSNDGDLNGDGLDDLVIGAPGADPRGRIDAGQTYVVFGKADGAPVEIAEILAGQGGFAFDGIRAGDLAGMSSSGAGDVDGDGFADLILRAPLADGPDTPAENYLVFGGDLTASVDLLGSAGDDELVGTAADEIIVGGRGDDALIGGGGADVLNGAAGDDLLAITDVGFRKLLGGSGTDTLRLDGAGETLDLTATSDLLLRDVEQIDLNGDGNDLVLNTLEILNSDDNSNILTVFGDATNAVCGDLSGATAGQTTVGGVTFASFAVGNAELLVQNAVDTSGVVV